MVIGRETTPGKILLVALHIVAVAFAFVFIAPVADASEAVDELTSTAIDYGSGIAFAIIVVSVLTAWTMNYRAPKVRVFGTLLAATGCFAIVVWFTFVAGTGFLENPRPSDIPMDMAKPALLWLQSATALLTGCALLFAAFVQSKSSKTLELSNSNEPARYGRVSRLLHWSIAILILIMIPMGVFTTIIPEDVWYRRGYYSAHQTIGVVIIPLVLLRLVWNRISARPVLAASLRPWERKLAHLGHVSLYVFLIALPVTGYMMTSYSGHDTLVFGHSIQPFWGQNQAFAMTFGMAHKYLLPYMLYIVLGSHVLGALKHKFIDKHEDALSRMVS